MAVKLPLRRVGVEDHATEQTAFSMSKNMTQSTLSGLSDRPSSATSIGSTVSDFANSGGDNHSRVALKPIDTAPQHGEKDVEKAGDSVKTTTTEVLSQDPNITDFDGPNDPTNPLNWTTRKKQINIGILSAMTFITPLASSMFAPGVPEVLSEFGSTNSLLGSFVVSVYVLGYAPLCELYGRAFLSTT